MITDINICSNAFVLLGGSSLASFTDGSTEAQIASQLYKTTYHSLLTATRWHFATRTAKLSRHAGEANSGFNNKFQLPQDCLYVVSASVGSYEIYERNLHSNANEITIDYVYPVNEINLPAYFITALEFTLASKFAIPLTGSISKADYYAKEAFRALVKARFNDASQRPNYAIGDAPYLSVRN